MVDVSEKMIEAGLAAYGGFKGGIPRSHGELCRDIYTAMHSAREVDGETVERVALAMLEASGRNISDPDQRREVAMAYYGYMAKCAIAAMGEGDG